MKFECRVVYADRRGRKRKKKRRGKVRGLVAMEDSLLECGNRKGKERRGKGMSSAPFFLASLAENLAIGASSSSSHRETEKGEKKRDREKS